MVVCCYIRYYHVVFHLLSRTVCKYNYGSGNHIMDHVYSELRLLLHRRSV